MQGSRHEERHVLPKGYRMPAEWEPHDATWLVWPQSDDWPGKLSAVQWTVTEVIRKLSAVERVSLVVSHRARIGTISERLRRAAVELDAVEFFIAPTDRTWARDNLPSFVVKGQGSADASLGAVKFLFNGWARYEDHELDEAAGAAVAEHVASDVFFPNWRNRQGRLQRFVLEGGAIDVDGRGTLLTTRRCLVGAPFTRNPGVTSGQVEETLQQNLGVSKVIWLEDGIAGDDTSGHVDDFARFVAPGQVVHCVEEDVSDANYAPLKSAQEQLESAVDATGSRLDLVALPMPAPLYFEGERLPASYANFYIANDVVLVPTFNDPLDRVALGTLAEVFPRRQVVGIHAVDLVLGLGTLHCSTQQQPSLCR